MHSGDLNEMDQSPLTEQEKEALLEVMERAKEFDKQVNFQTRPVLCLEGQLFKWTNPLKGWQPRWFSVDHQQGVLHYYTSEDKKKQPPRGSLHLWGAVVAPSEDDSQTFSVNGANGEVYKLRGQGPKQRQFWVSKLRGEVESCTNQSTFPSRENVEMVTGEGSSAIITSPLHNPSTPTKAFSKRMSKNWMKQGSRMSLGKTSSGNGVGGEGDPCADSGQESQVALVEGPIKAIFPGGDAMSEMLTQLQRLQEAFSVQLQTCVSHAAVSATDQNVLLVRATSQAAVCSVKDCLALIKLGMANSNCNDHSNSSQQQLLQRSASSSPAHSTTNNNLLGKVPQSPLAVGVEKERVAESQDT